MNSFKIDGIEYCIIRNPYTNGPMIARADGGQIENRKEICRRFLREHGWTDEQMRPKITNDLERAINKILNGEGNIPTPPLSSTLSKGSTSKLTRRTARDPNIQEPSVEEVEHWLMKWNELEDYVAQERAIDKLFLGEFNSNEDLQNILIKCSVLNDFYSTNIFKIYPVAKHILSLHIDKRLKEGDATLVDDIARIEVGGKEKNFYSFASKYCSHHFQKEFPIYDSYVHKVLVYFRRVDGFASFEDADLKNYPKFKAVLIKFRSFYHLEQFDLKQLDQYLWQFGKAHFPKTYY